MNILHLTNTTLAGAPGMLAQATSHYTGHKTAVIQFNDRGPERYVFHPNVLYHEPGEWSETLLESHIAQADVIHIHNLIPVGVLAKIATHDLRDKKLFYQVHSPLYEPPNFGDLSDDHGLDFDAKLVIGHFHPRQFPDYKIIPNCLFRSNMFSAFKPVQRDKVRIIVSPSTQSSRRWSAKVSPKVDAHLAALTAIPELEIASYSKMPPEMLMLHRRNSDISIDEVLTGSYHLVSYEGMACGNVVVNGCDALAKFAFQAAFRTDELPPFAISSQHDLSTTIRDLAQDRAELEKLKTQSYDFFWDVMSPERVVQIFLDIYGI